VRERCLTAEAATDLEALIDAIALKMAVELGAELVRFPGAVAMRYPTPLHHPRPRAVEIRHLWRPSPASMRSVVVHAGEHRRPVALEGLTGL